MTPGKMVAVFLICLAVFPLGGGATAFGLTPERAADEALADIRHFGLVASSARVLLENSQDFLTFIRLRLNTLDAGEKGKGRFLGEYDIRKTDRRILRRDIAPGRNTSFAVENSPQNDAPSMAFLGDTPARGETTTGGGVGIHGVLRNIPGFILNIPDFLSRFTIWAEAQGRVVATETELIGTTVYHLKNIPVTAGHVAIKAKIRGYDLTILHPDVFIDPNRPGGVIAGIDIDFQTISPITRDVRILVRGTSEASDPSFPSGARARVYVRETGQSVDVISQNNWAEAVISGVPTGWPLNFMALNLDAGYHSGELGPVVIPEDGGSMYTDSITIR